ncbi:LysR family transcriptional regulator [Erwinia billingiae]|uniref:LysR family transcriptional regulator n=1 Tax=Erwinia billingiae TaxID=182337 RepID=UPI003207F508
MNRKENMYFLTLTEAGNVTKAAEMLGITQSSLSKYLKRLENTLGFALFVRHSAPLQLSPAGRIYLDHAREMAHKELLLEQKFKGLKGLPQGEVTVGLTLWRSEALLPLLLPGFQEKYPFIKVRVCEGNHKQIYSLLEKKEIDFGIINLQLHYEKLIFEALKRERILIAVNKKNNAYKKSVENNLVSRERVTLTDFSFFQNEPLIQLKPGSHLNLLTRNFITANGYSNPVILETENIATAYRLVEKNVGITFVPEGLLKTIRRSKDVAFFTTGRPILAWELGITYPVQAKPGRAAELFITHLRNVL